MRCAPPRTTNPPPPPVKADGYAYLHQVAPNLVLDPHVTVTRNATTVNVDVTGHVLSIGPSTDGPRERQRPGRTGHPMTPPTDHPTTDSRA